LGVAPQELALYPELTARENLRYFGRLYGLSGTRLRERVAWTLAFVDLESRADDRAGTYSGGMQRRLNLALALLHEPRLLICDEPTVGVDPQSRNAILQRLIELKQNGQTVLYTTHYLEEAEQLCDSVAIMDHGKMLAEGTVDNLIHQHAPEYVVVAENHQGETRTTTSDPAAVLRDLQQHGPLGRIHIERPSLEAVFLQLTGHEVRDG
jgi:ABC-2 type transport system ATP-binding protein